MTEDDHVTHAKLAEQLRGSIERLRTDVESRGDPMLEEIAHALDVILELTTHAHDHALQNRDRIRELETRLP
jgi:BMFP domain-containing protein YqiC